MATEPLVRIGHDERLDKWMKFLDALDCLCDFSYIGLGRLHGINMGKGWVRITTHPKCPQHALCRGYTKDARAKRDNGRFLYCPVHATKDCDRAPKRRAPSDATEPDPSRPLRPKSS